MAPLPSRKSLESMKRVDLQKLCKDYGVKANLKSEALIDLLIDTARPPSTPARRSVSTRQSSRAGPGRISSIIIHDTDKVEEDETNANCNKHDHDSIPASTSYESANTLATRTRKRKEQTRLGVGRPVVAGGAGPRAVTKSLSLTKGKRGKASRALKTSEATIPEEEVEQDNHIATQDLPDEVASQERFSQALGRGSFPEASIDSLATIDKHVADALRPLHEQMKSMKSELASMQVLKTEVEELKARIDEIGSLKEQVESLTATIRDLRKGADEVTASQLEFNQRQATLPVQTAPPSTPKMQGSACENRADPSSLGIPQLPMGTVLCQTSDSLAAAASSTNADPHPGIAPSMLGKRHRDSAASEFVHHSRDIGRAVDETTHTKPSRKRARISSKNDLSLDPNISQEVDTEDDLPEQEETRDAFPGSSFGVFSGLEVSPMELADPPPPTESLPDFFAASLASDASMIPRRNCTTSTTNATENQPPFAFSFQHAISSTPAHGMFMPSFPYPEPPQSPSPAGTSAAGLLSQQQPGRSDVFQAFGFPPPGRPSRTIGLHNTSGLTGSFIDPATLTRQSSNNGETSESGVRPVVDASASSGMGLVQEPSHMKRTMYGTELDGDTRFGDFGLEGVGNAKGGFWAGGRF
ncbi:hypothetical protein E4T56_gene1665 [Termitomyces sp. T112]|nr:hypothetical protein E4T56_gene1665 [Termitomyces sp. T112]